MAKCIVNIVLVVTHVVNCICKCLHIHKNNSAKQLASKRLNANPYELLLYKQGWSQSKIAKNNAKFWEWELTNNKFK